MSAMLTLPTGVRLHYTDTGPADGEAVLCLHGYSDSAFSFSPLVPLLPAAWRVVAIDQRGHGDSERPAGGYGIGDLAADAVAVLDVLGIRRATVVGHSMGSFVAQRVALEHPERVGRLVLIGSAAAARDVDAMEDLRAEVGRLEDPVPRDFVHAFQRSAVHRVPPAAFMERVVAESLKLPARVWRAVLEGFVDFDHAGALGAVPCPTLIVWGQRDGMFGRATQERLWGAMPGARVVEYADTGHTPQWERAGALARDLVEFVGATAG